MAERTYSSPRISFRYPDGWELTDGDRPRLTSPAGGTMTFEIHVSPVAFGERTVRLAGRDLATTGHLAKADLSLRQWTLMRGDVLINVVYAAKSEVAAMDAAAITAIVGDAEPAPSNALSMGQTAFMEDLIRRLRRQLPQGRIYAEGMVLVVDDDTRLDVAEVFRDCQADPSQRATRVDEFLGFVQSHRKLTSIVSRWVTASKRVMPMLVAPTGDDDRVLLPFTDGLSVGYGIDMGSAMAYVKTAMLASWGVAGVDVHEAAMANLTARPAAASHERMDGIDVIRLAESSFATGLILVPDLFKRAAEQFGSDLVVAIPSRELVIIARSADRARLARRARSEHDSAAHPLTPLVFRYGMGTLEPLEIEPSSWIKRMFRSA